MPKCNGCRRKWSWFETIKSSFVLNGLDMKCPYCKKRQYLTAKSKKKSAMSVFFIISPVALFYNLSPSMGLASLIGACLFYIGISPYLVEFSNKKGSP